MFDVASIIIGIGRTDTHCTYVFDAAHHIEGRLQGFDGCLHIVFEIGISSGGDDGLRFDGAALVHDAEYGVGTAHVKTDDIGLFNV